MKSLRAASVAPALACLPAFLPTLVPLPLAALSAPAVAQPAARIPTVTRLVRLFTEREAGLLEAARARDSATLERALDAGFEMRSAASPAQPVPRDAWIRAMISEAPADYRVGQMAVHEFPGVCVVSFTLTPPRGARAGALFVVDSWTGADEDWILRARHVSAAGPFRGPVPGGAAMPAAKGAASVKQP